MYIRVGPDSTIEAAKPVKEGISAEAQSQLLQRCQAQEVCNSSSTCCICYPSMQLTHVPAGRQQWQS